MNFIMFRKIRDMATVNRRTFKNFGHKRQPIPFVTTLWHGSLTFTFIGLAIEWKRIRNFIFGDEDEEEIWAKLNVQEAPSNSEA